MPAFVVFGNLTYTFEVDVDISWIFLYIYGPWIYNHIYCLGRLPQGSYSFSATAYWVLNGTRQPFARIIKSFTVTSAPPPPKPVGGYSLLIEGPPTTKPLTPYLALIAILTISFTAIKRKTARKTK